MPKRRPTSKPRSANRVLCRDDSTGYLYPGRIQRAAENRSFIVFDAGVEQSIDDHILIPLKISNKSDLIPFDTVLVRQEECEHWLPGIILSLSTASDLQTNIYQIKTYDPKENEVNLSIDEMLVIRKTNFIDLCISTGSYTYSSIGISKYS